MAWQIWSHYFKLRREKRKTSERENFMQDRSEFLDILTEAIRRETNAFNYYYTASEKSPSAESKSLLIQVAEEHKTLSSSEMVKSSWVHWKIF